MDPKLLSWLRDLDRFLLVGHADPDGDCLGSMVALAELLRDLGKKPTVLLERPPDRHFDFLPGLAEARVWKGGEVPPVDLVILLDCHQVERTGALAAPLARREGALAVIDHHRPGRELPPRPDRVWVVDPEAAATALLVLDLHDALARRPGPAAAQGLLTGLLTDTWWLQNRNADARAVAGLARIMADCPPPLGPDQVHDRVCRRQPAGVHRLLSLALGRVVREGGLALTWLTAGEIEDAGLPGLETELILRPLMAVEGVETALVLYEKESGRVKLSLRSRGGGQALALASSLGGGGHREAAGASMAGTLEEAREKVLAAWRSLA